MSLVQREARSQGTEENPAGLRAFGVRGGGGGGGGATVMDK